MPLQAEADAFAASKVWRTARGPRLERENGAKLEAEAKRRKELQEAAAPKPLETPAPILETILGKFTLDNFPNLRWLESPNLR